MLRIVACIYRTHQESDPRPGFAVCSSSGGCIITVVDLAGKPVDIIWDVKLVHATFNVLLVW